MNHDEAVLNPPTLTALELGVGWLSAQIFLETPIGRKCATTAQLSIGHKAIILPHGPAGMDRLRPSGCKVTYDELETMRGPTNVVDTLG